MSTAQGESMTKGTPLASAFAEAGGVQRVFDGKAHDYERARPGYPAALYEHIESLVGRGAVLSIADIGAGTGLFTCGWLDRGHRVVAVEPNDPMREAADALLRGQPRYRSTNGSAEATAVADASVDLVTAAQAFHWFDALAFRAESLRILRPGGLAAIVWNDRADDDLNRDLTALFADFGGARRAAIAAGLVQEEAIGRFFGNGSVRAWSTTHAQLLDAARFAALAFSRSFMPPRDSAPGAAAQSALQEIFDRWARDGHVRLAYVTHALVGRPA